MGSKSDTSKTSESSGGNVCGRYRFQSPGSILAKGRGCTCPSGVNDLGRGNPQLAGMHMGRRWVYEKGCPVHKIDPSIQPVADVKDEPTWMVLLSLEEAES